MFEIQDQPNAEFRNPQIVQHFAPFVIGYSFDYFRIHNYRTERDQIGDELSDLNATKQNRKPALLIEGDPVLLEQNDERIFINLLMQAMSNFVQHGKCKTDNLFSFGFQQEFRFSALP